MLVECRYRSKPRLSGGIQCENTAFPPTRKPDPNSDPEPVLGLFRVGRAQFTLYFDVPLHFGGPHPLVRSNVKSRLDTFMKLVTDRSQQID